MEESHSQRNSTNVESDDNVRALRRRPRIASLDIFRGFTVALMVFVDDLAERYPHITHAPWNGLTLADLVMPCFLFMVGCSMAFSLKQYIYTDAQMHGPTLAKYNTYSYWRNYALRIDGTKHALYRAFKLFGLGLILQGGEEFSDNSYYYGWNLRTLRWCGILNRIAFAYLVAVLLELWLPYTDPSALRSRASSVVSRAPSSNYRTTPANENAPLLDHGASDNGAGEERKFGRLKIAANQMRGSLGRHLAVFRMGVWQWVGAVVAVCVHLLLTYLTWVPTWESHYRWDATGALEFLDGSRDAPTVTIECDVRGSTLSPECSAQGFYDRLLFGQDHLHNWRSVAMEVCSSCSPGECPAPDTAPVWCGAHIYDPEGSLSSIACIATVLIGLHYGKVVTANKLHSADGLTNNGSRDCVKHWGVLSVFLTLTGLALHHAHVILFNKQLYSLSYMLTTAGVCGLIFACLYVLVDTPHALQQTSRRYLAPLQYLGMNAIFVFVVHGVAEAILHSIYINTGPNPIDYTTQRLTVLTWLRDNVLANISGEYSQLLYVLFKILCFILATGYLYRIKCFYKI